LTALGIVVKDDGGLLFGLAVTVFVTSAVTAFLHRRQIPIVSQLLKPQTA
jgi:putative oxidoreductase